ncbi:response regulator transcription factor [Enteractinococcus coprophilus]|uniref:DNA-binding response OmpR family regulator n=1 Tax=Enteractinococcus coprophilus TaxID=1027633 RepID=A0A543AMZ7_9MICC|nr:response regulator transcription factor [Enteractinococcus coprophilus]TQL73938.1 DNA-binding response OmpR family regulator [Enteractinococcus coprophilus]
MNRILIIEDEPRISSFLAKGLKAAGFTTQTAATAAEGRAQAISATFDLIILDLGLPDADGYSVLNYIRSVGLDIPVIILTARNTVDDTVAGLQSGADDYMAKPFHFDELLARVQLRLRAEPQEAEVSILTHNGLELDRLRRVVKVNGVEVDLSTREFELAETFLRHPGQALSREQLLSRVWGYDFDPASNVVDVYVRYLRNKLGTDRFETVRGIGYRLATQPDS